MKTSIIFQWYQIHVQLNDIFQHFSMYLGIRLDNDKILVSGIKTSYSIKTLFSDIGI
jgi:hypothetical protein